jgi:hypothetical protein
MTALYLATAVERRAIHQFIEFARAKGVRLSDAVTGCELTVLEVVYLLDRGLQIDRAQLNAEREAALIAENREAEEEAICARQ